MGRGEFLEHGNGFLSLVLLHKSECGIENENGKNDERIQKTLHCQRLFLKERCDEREEERNDEDVHHDILELLQEEEEQRPLLLRERIETILFQTLLRFGRLQPPKRAAEFAQNLVDGLEFVHRRKV